MVSIEPYGTKIEEIFYFSVEKQFSKAEKTEIVNGCKKFFPLDFFVTGQDFKQLVLAPYSELKRVYEYIKQNENPMLQECFPMNVNGKREIKEKYKKYCEKFSKVTQTIAGDKKVNVMIVRAAKITVCPYCNRDYINSRSKVSAGAQLDHFYPKSLYPFFALSLYNLVPVCATCNLVKRDNKKIFASPFDSSINWDDEIQFKFPDLEATPGFVEIHAENRAKNNICELKIQEAYQVHEIEIKEIVEKAQAYNTSQLDEFKSVLGDNSLTRAEVKKLIFGDEITPERMKTMPLGRMKRDLERELGVYGNEKIDK